MVTERSEYSAVFRQWVRTSEQLFVRMDELRPINLQINDGNRDAATLETNGRLQEEINRLHQRRNELSAELIRLTVS